jgi:hypothetical protein
MALMVVRRAWSHLARITIWKTFIQPIYSYCRGPYLYWLLRRPPDVQKVSTQIEKDLHSLELDFLFGYTVPVSTLDVLLLLPPLVIRNDWTKAAFVKHLANCTHDNPIRTIRRNMRFSSMSTHSFLARCDSHAIVTEWTDKVLQADSQSPNMVWKEMKLNSFWTSLASSIQILPLYFKKHAMHATRNMWDGLAQSKSLVGNFLAWRLNKFALNKKCSGCQGKFNRRHIMACNLLGHLPAHQEVLNSPSFIQNLAIITQKAEKLGLSSNFNVLDHCLNSKDYKSFSLFHSTLQELLG